MGTGHAPCCLYETYSIRRYSPGGHTLWTRDYYRGAVGFLAGHKPLGLRVAVLNDRIYVAGEVCWSDPEEPSQYWSLAAYTIGGTRLWRRNPAASDLTVDGTHNENGHPTDATRYVSAEAAIDVASSSDGIYLLKQSPPTGSDFSAVLKLPLASLEPPFAGGELALTFAGQFGRALAVGSDQSIHVAGPISSAGPTPHYVRLVDGAVSGLTTPGEQLWGALALNEAGNRTFLGGVSRDAEGHNDNPTLASVSSTVATTHWTRHVLSPWSGLSDETVNAIAAMSDGGCVAVNANSTGIGTIGRYAANGDQVWRIERASKSAVAVVPSASDVDPQSIYVGGATRSNGAATVQKLTPDGERLWRHRHFVVTDAAVLSDGSCVCVGLRSRRGINEESFIQDD